MGMGKPTVDCRIDIGRYAGWPRRRWRLSTALRTAGSLRMAAPYPMGASYAETLRRWDESFLAASDRVLALGFDETFLRMWHFYLEYARAGFASGYLDVNQLVFERES